MSTRRCAARSGAACTAQHALSNAPGYSSSPTTRSLRGAPSRPPHHHLLPMSCLCPPIFSSTDQQSLLSSEKHPNPYGAVVTSQPKHHPPPKISEKMLVHPHLGYANPVIDRDWADPGVCFDAHSQKWYAYSTNANGKNIQVASSSDFCSWQIHDEMEALPAPFPPWTGKPGFFWAPDVVAAPGGRPGFLMYVACHDWSTDHLCIGVAYSAQSPLGPFYFVGNGPIVSRGETGGCIDPCVFIDPPSGHRFLVYKNDYSHMRGPGPQIWIQALSEDGLSFVADRQPLLSPTHKWDTGLIEAPHLVYDPDSRTYVLFFSSGTFSTSDYATGFATSKNLFGPYESNKHPLLQTHEPRGIIGPGGQCVVRGVEGHWFIVFHSHNEKNCQGGRRMSVHRITFDQDGKPQLAGKPIYRRRLRLGAEAEDSKLEHHEEEEEHHEHRHHDGGGASAMGKKMAQKVLSSLQKRLD